jgi:hypothetical protein
MTGNKSVKDGTLHTTQKKKIISEQGYKARKKRSYKKECKVLKRVITNSKIHGTS